jgi:hypothetical protein
MQRLPELPRFKTEKVSRHFAKQHSAAMARLARAKGFQLRGWGSQFVSHVNED